MTATPMLTPMKSLRTALLSGLVAVACNAALAQAAPAVGPAMLACLVLPDKVAELGSPVIGVVDTVEVERGARVRKGQVLARLKADVERANSGVVRSRADSEAEWRGAVAGRDLAQQKLDRARSLAAQNFVSGQAVEQADAEFRVAKERMLQAREQLGTNQREVSSAQAQVAQRIVRAPFDGVVTERYVNPGERVEDKPMLRVAVITQLRVEVVASTTQFGNLAIGQEMAIQPELPGLAMRTARIAQMDQVLEPASNTFRLRLELPNENGAWPAGLRCKAMPVQASAASRPATSSALELSPVSARSTTSGARR